MNAEVDRPRVVPAPVIFFGILILGFLLNWVLPLAFFPGRSVQIAGVIILVPGFLIGGSGIIEMRRAHTSPDPREPTTALVEKGVFRYTRNPLYLSMFVFFLGIAVFLDVLWLILLFPLLLFVVERGTVKPEELYLERKFGEAYLQYRKHVPRWMC
ncbi:MAG: isoprenylcysteine carboxylmethyltransferase family protein [Candidatus Bathyarchaeia archaeon]